MESILTLILSFAIFSALLKYIVKYLVSKNKISFKSPKNTKGKIIWTIICCTIYIIGYVLIDFIGLGIIGFNIARGFLLSIFVTLLLLDNN
ncbi:hypothetical protein [uncultured Clostridium sp.]|uniref:hypothetical protein n=1 Tax=uncultured Clostridium sp. TaxID=59620 RepID=UPI0025842DB0|nr:hypothetical protein [uncultured Clostridium sp.]